MDFNAVKEFMYRDTGSLPGEHETLTSQFDHAAFFLAGPGHLLHVGYGGAHDGLMIGTVAPRPLP